MIYELTSRKWEGVIRLEYWPSGNLKTVQMPEVIDANSLMWLSTRFPGYEDILPWLKANTGARIEKVVDEWTFDQFWDAYKHKAGSKDEARMLWEGAKKTTTKRPITSTDRNDIQAVVPGYASRYTGDKKTYQPLATTFLYQRLWVAELERRPRKNEAVSELVKKELDRWGEAGKLINTEKNGKTN